MRNKKTLFFCFAMALSAASLVWTAPEALGAPLGFRRPRASFQVGISAFDALTGTFGKVADVGMAVFAEAGLQLGGYYGINVRFASARAFTHKDFLPFDEGYQYISLTLSPRFYLAPFRKFDLYFYAQPDLEMQIFESNTLVTLTGNRATTGAVGGSLGGRFIVGILDISAQATCLYNWNVKTVIVAGSLAVGITSTL